VSCVVYPLADGAPSAGLAAGWITLGILVVAGLVVGINDVRRLQFRRIWALSGVCFTEAMRRRVLLVTPLAILGLVVVCQFQQASDDQDAIRQTAKFCVFASGLVVVVTALILACTNLPREIENRVIFTIVTKPTTRLEIVLGKVLGFARVSAAILLVMGVFSYCYLEGRNYFRVQNIRTQLATLPADAAGRATLVHYADHGFLETRSMDVASDLNIYARPPANGLRWIRGGRPEYFLVHFAPSEAERGVLAAAAQAGAEVDLVTTLHVEWPPLSASEQTDAERVHFPQLHPAPTAPFGPALQPSDAAPKGPVQYAPILNFRIVDAADRNLINPDEIGPKANSLQIVDSQNGRPSGVVPVLPKAVEQLADLPEFYVDVASGSPGVEYGAGALPVVLFIPSANNGKGMTIDPPLLNGQPEAPRFSGRPGRSGIVLSDAITAQTVAIFSFRGATPSIGAGQKAAFQLNAKIERTGDPTDSNQPLSVAEIEVINSSTGKSSGPIRVTPEINRMTFFDVPAEDVAGGNFDVQLREMTDGQWLDLQPDSIVLITADRSFSWNLMKSFLLLWMLSILVVAISVFCSTFLSWPIAVVLSLLLLLGHWGVAQLGDSLNPGVGHTVSNEFFSRDPTESKVVSTTMEALAKSLRTISSIFPDVSQFPASEDLERGVSISFSTLGGAAESLLIYGASVIIGGYIILRYKEVAP
jgi:ABC-type transport system involved in multi-copper enzyme maturation permease subunit